MSSTYRFKKTDQNYINALVKYLKDVPIFSIKSNNGKTVDDVSEEHYTCKDLPKILPTLRGDSFEVTCPSVASTALPDIDHNKLVSALHSVSNEEMSLITDHNIFKTYFDYTIVERSFTATCHMGHEGSSKKLAELRPNLTKTEAILLLQQIDENLRTADVQKYIKGSKKLSQAEIDERIKSFKISHLWFMPENELFLFCIKGNTYSLRFGKQPEFGFIDDFCFDLDDGFRIMGWDESKAEKFAFITDNLNARFEKWKASGYEGDFIKGDESGLVDKVVSAPVSVTSSSMFGKSNSKLNADDEIVIACININEL